MKLQIKSFATRLSIYIISFIIIVFSVIMAVFYTYSRDKITEHAVQHTHGLLKNMATQIDGLLMTIETTMHSSKWVIEENLSNPDSLYRIVAAVVRDNDLIVGSGIAFEPEFYKSKGYYFMPFAFMNGDNVVIQALGSKEYDYPCMDWYLLPKLQKEACWSEPYYDQGGGNIIMTTYSMPLIDKNGHVFAVFTANISLSQFTDMVDELKPFELSHSFMLSRYGGYLTHPNREKIMNETIFSNAFESKDSDYEHLGREMIAGKTGTVYFEDEGHASYAFYTSIPNIGWSVCNVCPGDVILQELAIISRKIIYLFIAGVALLFFISYYIIKRLAHPLEDFSKSARDIAKGRFDVKLPDVKSKDEMKDLHDSFEYMQKSLSEYVEELRVTTVVKERIESELYIAQEIQMGMIPKTFPPFPARKDVDLHAILRPAKEVGGDLYDFFLEGNKLYFAIGDVSGKGIPASLFMAITRSLFRSLSAHKLSPGEIVKSMNDSISENNDSNMFVTLIVGILDLETGLLKFCNAGHNPPLLIKPDGSVSFMKIKQNLFAGIMEGFEYEDEEIILETGTKLFLYTDGITEAENQIQELYSEKRLIEIVEENAHKDVKEIVESTLDSVASHVKEAEQSDDLTVLVIHYKSKSVKNGERNKTD